MNTVTRNFGEIKMEYRAGNVSFSGSPQLPPVGMKLSEAIAAAKATLAIAFQRLDEISDYLATMREDGIYDGVSAHWGHD